MTRKTRGVVVALATVVLVVAAAGAAFGFTDDANAGGTTFVTAANALSKAGCAAGFGDGSFGYSATVTRGQDAIFQIACAPGIAYVNGTTAATANVTTTATTVGSVTFTAGINPGGLQYILARGIFTILGGAANTVTPTISVTPGAGGVAVAPGPQACRPATATAGNTAYVTCEAGFIVPTGTQLTVTLSATANNPTTAALSSLAVNSAPRGNAVPPAPGTGTLS